MSDTVNGRHAAETIATRALAYLASDGDRLGRFLALSGLDPSTIRTASQNPGFLPAVLDHMLGHERLLLDFVDAEGLPPEAIGRARRTLAPEPSPD